MNNGSVNAFVNGRNKGGPFPNRIRRTLDAVNDKRYQVAKAAGEKFYMRLHPTNGFKKTPI